MTKSSIIKRLLRAGYYCEGTIDGVVIVWSKDKGFMLPQVHHFLDYMCFGSYAEAFRTIIVKHITF